MRKAIDGASAESARNLSLTFSIKKKWNEKQIEIVLREKKKKLRNKWEY